VAHAAQFKNGRQCAAWLGLTPRQDSSAGKNRLLRITKRGDVYLCTLLVHGVRSIMRHTAKKDDPKSRWVEQLRRRRGDNVPLARSPPSTRASSGRSWSDKRLHVLKSQTVYTVARHT
jgi:transposase